MILEEILADVGDAGLFQYVFTTLITAMEVVIAWSMLMTAIVGATPDWWCVDPSTYNTPNMTLDNSTFQRCLDTPDEINGHGHDHNDSFQYNVETATACVRYYDPSFVTIVSEWNLVCERKYIKAVINSIQMAGVLVGSLIAGQASDTFGRRVTCYVTMVIHTIVCLVAGFSTSWQMYAVFRFLVGASIAAYLVLHYVYIVEFVRHTWRPYMASIPSWALGAGLMCLTAWQVPNWKYLHYICAGLNVPFCFGWIVSPESVRWLTAKGRVDEAVQVVNKIARMNGRSKPATIDQQLALLSEEEKSGETTTKYSYHLLFKGRNNALTMLILGFAWMSMSMSFYGIIFGVSTLVGNVFFNMFLLSMVEVPITVLTAVIVNTRLGRRWTAFIFFFLASLSGFGILIADRVASADAKGSIISTVAICSKLFIAAAWCCMQTFSTELYPTVIRSLCSGAVNVAARIGGILAPFVLEMETPDDAVKCYVIVGSIMAISGLSVLLLRETKGKALADTLNQEQKQLDPV